MVRRIIYPSIQAPVLTQAQTPESIHQQWHRPFSEPHVNLAKALATGLLIATIASGQSYTTFIPPPAQIGGAIGAIPTLDANSPSISKTIQYQARITPVLDPSVINVYPDKWHAPFSEPQRFPAKVYGFPANLNLPYTIIENITLDKWHQPASEPQRQPVGLKAYLHQYYTVDYKALTQPEAVHLQWLQPFSDPQRQPIKVYGFPTNLNLPYTLIENITLDKWYQAFSEPQRQPVGLKAYLHQYYAVDYKALTQPESVHLQWYTPFNEPQRQPIKIYNFPTNLNLPYTIAEVITLDKWFTPWAPQLPAKTLPMGNYPQPVQSTQFISPYQIIAKAKLVGNKTNANLLGSKTQSALKGEVDI